MLAPARPVSGPVPRRGWARPSVRSPPLVRCRSEAPRSRPAARVRKKSRGPLRRPGLLRADPARGAAGQDAIRHLVLAARFPPLPVFLGVGTAFGLQSAIAVTAGSLLTLLPDA